MYKINSVVISWNSIVRYLGVYIQSNLSWSHHCKVVSAKARRSLNHLRHSLWGATTTAKSVAYKCLIRPLLEYACQVWSPHTACDISGLESVQHHAARWACGSLFPGNGASHLMLVSNHYAGQIFLFVVTTCLSTLYDILNSRTSINFYDYYRCNTSCTRSHKLSVVPLPSSINSHRYSFFVNTAFLWNTVSFDILSIKSVNFFRRAIYRLFCT